MGKYVCVLAGGGVGSLTRYLLGRAIVQFFPASPFAVGTFVINVTGSFLIGILMTLIVERLRLAPAWHLVTVVGFLGGYTTFSSFEYDAYLATRGGHLWPALLYLGGSVVCGYGAVWLGVALANRLG
jgi:CrcB protein